MEELATMDLSKDRTLKKKKKVCVTMKANRIKRTLCERSVKHYNDVFICFID